MGKFYNSSSDVKCEYLLQATPFDKESRINFNYKLTEEEFFNKIYTEKTSKADFLIENSIFDKKIEYALRDINNPYAKVNLIHIAGYAGCGKTTYVHHLLWTLREKYNSYGLIDYQSCKKASEPMVSYIASYLSKMESLTKLEVFLDRIVEQKLFDTSRFNEQIPLLGLFLSGLESKCDSLMNKMSFVKYINDLKREQNIKDEQFISFLLFLIFNFMMFDCFIKSYKGCFVLVIDNADSLTDSFEESLLLKAIKTFEIDCNYFFGQNIKISNSFNNKKVCDVLSEIKMVLFFTTRIVSFKHYEIIEPDLENLYGWISLPFPEHYYEHKEVIDHRIDYYLKMDSYNQKLLKELESIKNLTDISYNNYNFMRLFNGNYRACLETICHIMSLLSEKQRDELNDLYYSSKTKQEATEGFNGYFLSLLLSVFKENGVFDDVLKLSPCRKDGTISLSRIILTIIREKGDSCSLFELFKLLVPIGFNAVDICTQVWSLSEISRQKKWRRLLLFDVIIPSDLETLKNQALLYEDGINNIEEFSELIICTAGKAYMEFIVPHFEFMLCRHEIGMGMINSIILKPLFDSSSLISYEDRNGEIKYNFDDKINVVYNDVKDCCYNSVMFAKKVQDYFEIGRDDYIRTTFYNYHSVGWEYHVGQKQSYESRLIFRHVGYIEKYRSFILKSKDISPQQKVVINEHLVNWIVKYLDLYNDRNKCFQTNSQNIAANDLLTLAKTISDSGYTDFSTRIERIDD